MTAEEKKAFLLKIGSRIKDARLKMGYSQEHLSELCGYNSRSTINKIEMGINDITQSKLQQISDVLQVSPAYLIGALEKEEESSFKIVEDVFETTPLERKIICRYRDADDLTKAMVLRNLSLEDSKDELNEKRKSVNSSK